MVCKDKSELIVNLKILRSHKLLRGKKGRHQLQPAARPGGRRGRWGGLWEQAMATSGWAPSRDPSASFFTPLFLTSSERPWESGESSPVGYPSCSTSTFISSQRPVLAAPEKIRVEKNNVLFLSSAGHLDIYRDLVHNHFNICECLLRESKRDWGQVFLPVSFRSRS